MEKVSILIPTRQRYKKLAKCLSVLFENTAYPNYEVVVITDRDDPRSTELVKKFDGVKVLIKEKREMYVGKINEGYHKTDSPLVVFLADDVEVNPNWLTEAVSTFNESFPDGMGLVSFQDEFDDRLAPHGLISRKYVEEFLNGNIFYPGYVHYWCDTELTVRSKRWGRFVHCPKAITKHHRARRKLKGKVWKDDHIRQEARSTMKSGQKISTQRCCYGYPDIMPNLGKFKLPDKVKLHFTPTEELYFYVGFGVDTRKKFDWETDGKTAEYLLNLCPMNFEPVDLDISSFAKEAGLVIHKPIELSDITVVTIDGYPGMLGKYLLPCLPREVEFIRLENSNNRNWACGAKALNCGIEKAHNDIIMCVHPDVVLGKNWFQDFILQECRLKDWGILGIVGTVYEDGNWGTAWGLSRPFSCPAQTLDECCLIIDRRQGLRFDEKMLGDTWHCYGIDYCLQCLDKGLGVYILAGNAKHVDDGTSIHLIPSWMKDRKGIMERVKKKWGHKFPSIHYT